MLLSWSRWFRGARSGVEKGIVIQELERPPPSGCCRLAVMVLWYLKVVFEGVLLSGQEILGDFALW